MTDEVCIAALYASFVATLPPAVQAAALSLPFRLEPSRDPRTGLRAALDCELTFGAPALFAEALPEATSEQVRTALLAHVLSVLEFNLFARITTGLLRDDWEMRVLRQLLNEASQHAMQDLGGNAAETYERERRKSHRALERERQILSNVEAMSLREYRAMARHKQSVRFVPTVALAELASPSKRRAREVERTLGSALLGLQCEKDALEWERQWRRGGAWAISVARGLPARRRDRDRPTEPDVVRRAVRASGALRAMLQLSLREFRATRRRAAALSAPRLCLWAAEGERRIAERLTSEDSARA